MKDYKENIGLIGITKMNLTEKKEEGSQLIQINFLANNVKDAEDFIGLFLNEKSKEN